MRKRWWQRQGQGKGGGVHQLVAWHQNLYSAMAIQIYYVMVLAKANNIKEKPYVLVFDCLHRVIGRLKAFLSHMCTDEEVDVAAVDSLRGRTVPILHF